MKSVGVIVEYNPFHNGHKYHLNETKMKTNADCVIAVMSGNFLQRGEPALVSKWARTKMAIELGVDLVIELPYAFSTQKAEIFANGAISLLNALHCQEVCFGSEHGTIDEFEKTVTFMESHQKEYEERLNLEVKKGLSYPKAASYAYHSLSNHHTFIDLSKPNNILGYHYVKAIKDQKCQMKATTIKRTSANYHDESFTSATIASATSIRKALFEKDRNLSTIENYIPLPTMTYLKEYYNTYSMFHQWENYFSIFKYKLLTTSSTELSKIYEVEEGIQNRFLSYIKEATSFTDFMEKVKTKRYTWTRLQRICLHILTNTTKDEMKITNEEMKATYIRILGMNTIGQQYLNQIKKKVSLPIITKQNSHQDPLFQLDQKATNTYLSIFPEPLRSSLLKLEYSLPPIRYTNTKTASI